QQHLRVDFDACRRIIGAHDLGAGRCVPNEPRGTADGVPDTLEPLAWVLERQPDEADDSCDNGDGCGDRGANRAVAARYRHRLADRRSRRVRSGNLVRLAVDGADIISGLFYRWDDAFRVGEYIDTAGSRAPSKS